jgi:hypothetical protein
MLDMLIGGATPLLSQTQAFDNALLLSQLSRPNPDSRALLRLVRSNRLQVRILDAPSLRQRPRHNDRFTLLNAFCSALAQPKFVLSAWPELADLELRTHVLNCLDHNPDAVSAISDPQLAARLEGLIEFDASLRQSSAIERTPLMPNLSLRARVEEGLAAMGRHDVSLGRDITAILGSVENFGSPLQLDRRSDWYRLLDVYSQRWPEPDDPHAVWVATNVRGVIDGAYNGIVAESLGATGAYTLCPNDEVAEALASTHAEVAGANQLTSLVRDPRRQEWLTWARLADLLPDFDHMANPQRRLGYVLSEHRGFVGTTEVDKRAGLALKVALPHAAASIMVGIAAGGLGESVGGGFGAALGAGVAGVLSLLAAHPAVGRIQRRWGEKTRHKAATQWEATVTSGTASIQGMVEK